MIPQIPVRVRFPNRYTGGYDSSTVTDKLKWQTISSVKKQTFNMNTDMTGGQAIAKKTYPCCVPPEPKIV